MLETLTAQFLASSVQHVASLLSHLKPARDATLIGHVLESHRESNYAGLPSPVSPQGIVIIPRPPRPGSRLPWTVPRLLPPGLGTPTNSDQAPATEPQRDSGQAPDTKSWRHTLLPTPTEQWPWAPPARVWPRRSRVHGARKGRPGAGVGSLPAPWLPRAHPPRAGSLVINKAQTDRLLISRSRWVLLGRLGTRSLLETLNEN